MDLKSFAAGFLFAAAISCVISLFELIFTKKKGVKKDGKSGSEEK